MKILFKKLRAGSFASVSHHSTTKDARNQHLTQMAIVVSVFCLGAETVSGESSACVPSSFEYRSCSGSRTWCGFDTFLTSTPRTKYRTLSQQDTASGYTWSGNLCYNGSSGGNGLYLSATGQITFSGSGTSACGVGTNWNFECWLGSSWVASISYATSADRVFYRDAGTPPASVQHYSSGGASASIVFVPAAVGSRTISCTEACNWSTNSTPPFVGDAALNLQSRTDTSETYANKSNFTLAARTRTLSVPYKRETVEQAIISQDLANCPTSGWNHTAIAAKSTMSGNTVSVTKVGYQVKLPQTQAGATYLLSWKTKVYDASGNLSGEEPAEAVLQGTGNEVSTGEIILLPPLNVGGSKIVDETSLAIKTVDGGSGCCGGSVVAGQGSASLNSVEVEFGLGKGRFGLGGGQLYLHQESLDGSSATPLSLKFAGDTNLFEVINDASGIRQVLGAQALADVIATNQYSYEIRFYSVTNVGAKVGGTYTVNNTPHTIWTVRNPDGATTINRLQVVETRGSKAITNEYQWSATNQIWTYISGNGLRTETKAVDWDPTNKVRTETRKIFTGTNALVHQEVNKYKGYSFGSGGALAVGMMLYETRIGLPGSEMTTTNTYINNIIAPRLDTVTRSDGSWEAYSFDGQGRVSLKYFSCYTNQVPVKNSNLTRYTQYSYALLAGSGDDGSATNSEPRTTYQGIFSQIFSYGFLVRRPEERIEIQSTRINGTWNDSTHLYTTNRYYTNGAFSGYLKSAFRPDGTAAIYSYATNSTQMLSTILDGQPDPTNPTNILDGTKTVTFVGFAGQTLSNVVYAIPQTNAILSQEIYSDFDGLFRPGRITYLDGTFKQVSYDCCGMEYEIDRDGTRTDYTYDDLKRLQTATRNGITTIYAYDGMGRVLSTSRRGTDNSAIILASSVYDTAGRLTARTNALGQATLFSESVVSNQTLKVVVNPDGGTITKLLARDGSLLEISGTAANPLRYLYGTTNDSVAGNLFTTRQEIRLAASGATNEWVRTLTDPAGRLYKTVYSSSQTPLPFERFTYNTKGLLTNQIDADGIITLFRYNGKAEREYTILDTNRNYVIDYAGLDRITRTVNDIVTNGSGFVVRRTSVYVWSTNSSAVSNLISTAETSTDGLRSWNTIWNNGTPATSQSRIAYDAANGYRYLTNIAPDNSYSVAVTRYGTNVSVTQFDALNNQLSSINYSYDAHGRLNKVTDARTGATAYTFNDADQVTSVTTPDPGTGAQITLMDYDNMGRVWKTTLPDKTSVTNEFLLTDQLKKTYGSRTHPVEYTYDAQGRMKTMKTWKDFAGNSGTATTTWNYDTYRGFLTNKTYDDGAAGPTYTYTAAGRLATRAWAHGRNTTYAYNWAGDLTRLDYSDSTPDVGYGYNRLGRQTTVTNDTTLVCSFAYNDVGELLRESYSSGPLSGLAVTNGYDSLLRRTAVTLNSQPSTLNQYGYDTASRLAAVANGSITVAYGYLANSPLVSTITAGQGGTTWLTTTKSYDNLNRLSQISSTPSADSVVSFNYQQNSANQRTAITNADSSRWVYIYDNLGQVVSGRKYWSDGTPVAGQQFDYTFDDIGNLKATAAGGDQYAANLRSATYGANSLNQYTNRTVPGYVDIRGSATNTATVTVNNQATYRKSNYFRAELTVTNSSGAVWLAITNLAVLNNGTNADIVASTIGNAYLPQTPEAFAYDADGNVTQDGRWAYTWDAENRAASFIRVSGAPTGAKVKLDCQYDYGSRRVQKIVSSWNGSAYVAQSTNRFVYDGWNLVAVLNSTNGLIYSFTWGLDASQTIRGAGGVGGLVSMTVYNGINAGTYFYAYDGNGNVAALVNATNGVIAAQYEYGAFGELLRATGPLAFENPFLFSTKFYDWETGFCYYGYRYYDPSTGRWLGRDPLEEQGGANLFAFVGNDSINFVDADGLALYAFDGTNNDRDRDRMDDPNASNGPSNVGILYGIYESQFKYYLNGVGTRESSGLKNTLGNAGGYGGKSRIEAMLKNVEVSLAGGDYTADVIGFSRGAAMARDFVNQLKKKYPCVKVRWLGIFDTVGSFGIGGNDEDIGYEFGIPSNVERVFHIVAGDEDRYFFPLVSIRRGLHGRPRSQNYREVVRPGAHSDIGGGYRDHRGLANAALIEMHKDGIAHNVPFGPIPNEYLDKSDKMIHDSRWLNDKAGPIVTVPLVGIAPNPLWNAKRRIYYHP